jgi:hypothetical protein
MKLKENSRIVYEFVREHENENITANDIAGATGLTPRQVNGIITMAFQRHRDADKNEIPLMERVPGEAVVDDNGKAKVPKYIKLTDAGRSITVEDAE